jgi:hypothetical protein
MASQASWWIKGGVAVALLAAIAAPLVLRAAPQRRSQPPVPPPAAGQSFAAVCKDDVALDGRPDPAWVLASYENDNCRAPVMPVALDGSTATRAQIVAGMAAAKRYTGGAQAFEKCIADAVAFRKARTGTPAGKSFVLVETHRMLVSEKNRKQAAARMAAAINAFNEYGSDCAD